MIHIRGFTAQRRQVSDERPVGVFNLSDLASEPSLRQTLSGLNSPMIDLLAATAGGALMPWCQNVTVDSCDRCAPDERDM
jgi:hypothetical protein